MKCFHPQCNRGIAKGDTLYRINAKGTEAIWACSQHRANTDAPRDPEPGTVSGAYLGFISKGETR